MKHFLHVAGMGATLLAASCCGPGPSAYGPPENDHDEAINSTIVQTAFDQNERSGVLAARTIYPSDFLPDQAALNDLGKRHVEILSTAHRGGPARVNIIRADAAPALYDARVAAVRQRLIDAGVDAAQITITDELPGGRGIPSDYAKSQFIDPNAKDDGSPNRPGGQGSSPRSKGASSPSMAGSTWGGK